MVEGLRQSTGLDYDRLTREHEKLVAEAQSVSPTPPAGRVGRSLHMPYVCLSLLACLQLRVAVPELGGKLREEAAGWGREVDAAIAQPWTSPSEARARLSELNSRWLATLAPAALRTKLQTALEAAVLLESTSQVVSQDSLSREKLDELLADLRKVRRATEPVWLALLPMTDRRARAALPCSQLMDSEAHSRWQENMQREERRLKGVRWVQSVALVLTGGDIGLDELQGLLDAPEADRSYPGFDKLGLVVEKGLALEQETLRLLSTVLEGRAAIDEVQRQAVAAARGVAEARGMTDSRQQQLGGSETPSPLKARSPATSPGGRGVRTQAPHFRVVEGEQDPANLMSARDMAAALRAVYKGIRPCGLRTPALRKLEQAAAELWWFSDVWKALRQGRPKLAALLELRAVADAWQDR